MHLKRIAMPALLAAGLALHPLAAAQAQAYYPPPCSPFPLFWPFCIVGAVVGTAATIVTAPFWAIAGPPYPPPYYSAPYPPPPGYRQPPPSNYGRGMVLPPPPGAS